MALVIWPEAVRLVVMVLVITEEPPATIDSSDFEMVPPHQVPLALAIGIERHVLQPVQTAPHVQPELLPSPPAIEPENREFDDHV